MTLLIGLGGYARSGKDTVADHLVAEYGFTKLGMSDALLEASLIVDPLVAHRVVDGMVEGIHLSEAVETLGYTAAKEIPEVREFLQRFGSNFVRTEVNDEYWVDKMYAKLHSIVGLRDIAVTGIRRRNELELIRDMGGKTIWVERPGVGPAGDHSTETELSSKDFDWVARNAGDLDDLHKMIDILIGFMR